MPRQQFTHDRVYQFACEPGPESTAVGYVRCYSEEQDPTAFAVQKRRIQEFAKKKGWKIVRWYEELEHCSGREDVEQRLAFAQVLNDAGMQFRVVVCFTSGVWSRRVRVAYDSLARLHQLSIWWATADSLWNSDQVERERQKPFCCLKARPAPTRLSARKEVM